MTDHRPRTTRGDDMRQTKTPAARAQERVDVLTRQLAKAQRKKVTAETTASAMRAEVDALTKRLTYAKSDPDLAARPTTSVERAAEGAK